MSASDKSTLFNNYQEAASLIIAAALEVKNAGYPITLAQTVINGEFQTIIMLPKIKFSGGKVSELTPALAPIAPNSGNPEVEGAVSALSPP